jgi:hypothetical protein
VTRSVSVATAGKLDANAWQPGFLVDMKLAAPLRFSTRGAVTWNGFVFVPAVLAVTNLVDDSSGGTLTFKDASLAIQRLVRTTDLVGRPVSIARFYEGATGATDPIWFFDGVIANAQEQDPPAISMALSRVATSRALTPPRRVNAGAGFTVLAPEGQVIRFRGSSFRLERARRG